MGTEGVSVQVSQLDEYTFASLALKQLALKQYMGTIYTHAHWPRLYMYWIGCNTVSLALK